MKMGGATVMEFGFMVSAWCLIVHSYLNVHSDTAILTILL